KKAIQSAKVNNNLKVKALVAEGDEFYNAKDYSDALISYLKALKLAPSNASVRKKVAKLKPSQSKATKNVLEKAMKYYAKKDYLNAKKYLLVAQQLNSSDAAI